MKPSEQMPQPDRAGTPAFLKVLAAHWNKLVYAAAGLFFIWGQFQIINQAVEKGIWTTVWGALVLALSMIDRKRLTIWGAALRRSGIALMAVLQKLREKKVMRPDVIETVEAPESSQDPEPAAEAAVVPQAPGRLDTIWVRVPKWLILGLSGVLVAGSQWLLFKEHAVLAIFVFALGGAGIYGGLKLEAGGWRICTLRQFLKIFFICLPGFAFMAAGNILLVLRVHQSAVTDGIGLALNAVGILLLFSLMPPVFPDAEAQEGRLLDAFSRDAKTRKALIGKWILAALGLGLLIGFQHVYGNGDFNLALLMAAAGLGLLGWSFPLALRPADAPVATGTAMEILVHLLRFSALAAAVFFAYKGQTLMRQELFYPGLAKFLTAGIFAVLAFREPQPVREDPLREKPLAWYWEALLLLAILGVAVWLRVRLIEIMPYGIECDEAGGTNNAIEMRENMRSLIAHPAGAPLFTLMPRMVSTALFGIGNVGVKADAIFFGVVGILTVFLMARMFWGPRTALAVAALVTVSRWHLHFSRFGFTNTFFITLIMLGFYFLIKGMQSRRKWHFLMGGMAMALSVQSETAGRLMPLIGTIMLVYFALSQKRFFQRNWMPVVALILGVWMAGAGIFIFFVKNNHILLRRVHEVSVYSGDVNAPRQIGKGLIDNFRISMGMLNFHGDYRTRHNGGMSGEPVLDFWTSIMFVLGFFYALFHWRRWRYGFLLLWFFGFMSASIFSIEAPQSHRAFGIFPAVFLLIGGFLDRSRRLLQESFGKVGWLAGILAFCLLMVPISKTNFKQYFETIPAFDTNCTTVARYIGQFDPAQWEIQMMTAYFWQGHPPFILYASKMSGRFNYYAHEVLPYALPELKNITYPLVLEYQPLLPTVKWFYPQGRYVEEKHDKYGTMFKAWEVKKEDVAATRGLQARYWNNTGWAGEPAVVRKDDDLSGTVAETWPLQGSGSMAWEGTIRIPHEGNYTFYLYGRDYVDVTIGTRHRILAQDRQEVQREIYLPAGLHRFRARAKHLHPDNRILFGWSSKEGVTYFLYKNRYQNPFFKEPFPKSYYFTYTEPVGLLETFYQTKDWTGKVAQEQVQPALLYWSGFSNAFRSIAWQGYIDIDTPGQYQFQLDSNEFGELLIDQQYVCYHGQDPRNLPSPKTVANSIYLDKGRHRIEGKCSEASGGYRLWWRPPGKEREIVPAWVLSPAEK